MDSTDFKSTGILLNFPCRRRGASSWLPSTLTSQATVPLIHSSSGPVSSLLWKYRSSTYCSFHTPDGMLPADRTKPVKWLQASEDSLPENLLPPKSKRFRRLSSDIESGIGPASKIFWVNRCFAGS